MQLYSGGGYFVFIVHDKLHTGDFRVEIDLQSTDWGGFALLSARNYTPFAYVDREVDWFDPDPRQTCVVTRQGNLVQSWTSTGHSFLMKLDTTTPQIPCYVAIGVEGSLTIYSWLNS